MFKKTKKYISLLLVLSFALFITSSTMAHESTSAYQYLNFQVDYYFEGESVVESLDFIDSDGIPANIKRIVSPDGRGVVTLTKNGSITTQVAKTLFDYKTFCNWADSHQTPQSSMLLQTGCGYMGSNFRHTYISTISETINISATATLAGIVSLIVSCINPPVGVCMDIATLTMGALNGAKGYVFVSDQMFETRTSYDLTYLFHCYHVYSRVTDSGGHFLNDGTVYYQRVGG